MLADTSVSLFSAVRAMRRGNWSEAGRRLGMSPYQVATGKNAANGFLGFKYGFVPLMQDLHEGYNWFADNADTPLLLSAIGTSSRTYSGAYSYSNYDAPWSYSSKAQVKLTAKITDKGRYVANQGGLLNPLAIGWELVPYSFVLDWWMPVGNILQSYSDLAGLDFVMGYASRRTEASVTYPSWTSRGSSAVHYSVGERTEVKDRLFSFTRNPYLSFPRPGVYRKQNWFNRERGIAALALFRQLFR
jgi:hypothetical protein